MSAGGYHHPLVERAGYHIDRVRAWTRRATLPGLLVRVAVWVTGAAALLLATPPGLQPIGLAVVVCVLALPAAAAPGGVWVAVLELIAIAVTAAASTGDSYPLWRILLVACVLYAHHSAAALGAQLRTDAVIPPAVLRGWATRTGLVLLCAVPLGFAVAVLAGQAPAGPATVYLALGAVAAVAVTIILVRQAHRQRGRSAASVVRGRGNPSGPASPQ